jgi:2-polyprenyl-3-methyl-5-hydroxy-6-metoxy-1,4-benzoquinol methylase
MNQEAIAEYYYNKRKDMNYYKAVLAIVNALPYRSVLDVGARRSPVLEALPSSKERVTLDKVAVKSTPGVRHIVADFFTWTPDRTYDLVLCLQVLEHLDHPAPFLQKLFATGTNVIVSVPYRWKKGVCKYHVQDPVTLAKVVGWAGGRKPVAHWIVKDAHLQRLICLFNAA